jgi:hypothetical protein
MHYISFNQGGGRHTSGPFNAVTPYMHKTRHPLLFVTPEPSLATTAQLMPAPAPAPVPAPVPAPFRAGALREQQGGALYQLCIGQMQLRGLL